MSSEPVLPAPTSPAPGRIIGWDLLRGCCAYAVGTYHLLTWQKVADLNPFGFFGVYLFFVLSGASLVINYHERFIRQPGHATLRKFLFVRYMRLLPLFAVLVLLSLPWKLKTQGLSPELLLKVVSNLSFTFGFGSPLTHSMIVGGWSLGIEFIFYLLFPVFLLLLGAGKNERGMWLAFAALLLLQAVWIGTTAGLDAVSLPSLVAYHQVPAFAAYFFGGCIIGWLQLQGRWQYPLGAVVGVGGVVLAGVVMLLLNHPDPSRVLAGWRGPVLCALCFVLVWWAGQIRLNHALSRFARHAGDVTYGVYLIHPFIYFGLAFVVAPRVPALNLVSGEWRTALPIGVGVLLLATLLAYCSERWFEQPVRRWSNRPANANRGTPKIGSLG